MQASQDNTDRTAELIKRADDMVREVQRSLEASDDALRGMGLDPEKVRGVVASLPMTAQQKEEAEQLFREDMEDVERQAAQDAAGQRQAARPSSGGARRPRPMV